MNVQKAHQRIGAVSNAHVGREFEGIARTFFAGRGIALEPNLQVLIGAGAEKKAHSFDLGCDAQKIIVECKSHRWTATTNVPSAKLTVWNEAMYFFTLAPASYRKIMFVLRHDCARRSMTLAGYYLRTFGHLVPTGVEFWEYDETVRDVKRIR